MEVKIIYSKRKTIGISVKDGNVILRSPYGRSEQELTEVLNRHKLWIERAIMREQKRREQYPSLTEEEEKKLRREAAVYFREKTKYYADIMQLSYNRISINGAKTRFGSCSSRGNINFSFRLMKYPESAREYVIVHELAHLKEMNHSERFYKIVEKYLPDYKERRRLLKIR